MIIGQDYFNPRIINILANVSQKMFTKYKFGYFERIQKQRLKKGSYEGIFRLTTGDNLKFNETIEYTGSEDFEPRSAYIVNFDDRIALPLYPLIFWYPCSSHPDGEHCYIYDKPSSRSVPCESFSFKAAGISCNLDVTKSNEELEQVATDLSQYWESDPELSFIKF